jgi:hypothetical protein
MVGILLLWLFVIPYIAARLFILVEIFRTFFFLSLEAFINTWAGNFPSWG